MNIHRVASDRVPATSSPPTDPPRSETSRCGSVEDHSSDLEVALDPVGAKPGDFVITISTPRLGKVERSHPIDAEEFYRLLDGAVVDDAKIFNNKLQQWEAYYNFHRPHGSLGGQTPYERLRQKTQTPV